MTDRAEATAGTGAGADTLGRPLRDLRVSVTDRCNFRCQYCMPSEVYGERYEFLPREEVLTFEEISRLARIFVQLGVSKVRVTGGEPLVRRKLAELIRMLVLIDGLEDLALTTNGILLAEHAASLRQAGLRRVTVSLDSLQDAVFRKMSGSTASPEQVLAGMDAAVRAGLGPVKVNMVVIKGVNDGEIEAMAARCRAAGHILRFIEYMDVGTLNAWERGEVVSGKEIIGRIHRVMPIEPCEPAAMGEVARRYRYRDGTGEIGVITSVTQTFCRGCTRARLSADGHFYTCLFADHGLNLRDMLRRGAGDDEIFNLIWMTWGRRTDRYSELRGAQSAVEREKVEMFRMGG